MAARLTTLVVVAIVAGTLIAGLIVGAQRDDNDGPIDLIVHNARVYTADDGAMAEAVAIRGNQILRVGSEREILRLKRPQTIMVDAKGAAVLPGFNDAHLDLGEGAAALDGADLRDAGTIGEVEERIREWAAANPQRPWILGRGWNRQEFGSTALTRQALDRAVPDRPVRLLSADGRSAWVNTRALRLAHIDRTTAAPAGGTILRESRTGEPSGLLQNTAVALVERVVPAPTPVQWEQALRAAVAEAHRFGVTSVQDIGATVDELDAYADARRIGDLRLRVYSALPVAIAVPDPELDRLEEATARYADDPLLKAGALALSVDRPAATSPLLNESQTKTEEEGFRIDPDALNKVMRRLDARGWQIIADAGTEMAVTTTLDAYEHAVRSNPGRTRERRHRIDNVGSVAGNDLRRFRSLGVLASMRPIEDDLLRQWGSDSRTSRHAGVASAALRVSDARGRLAFGSGWPSAPLNPLRGLGALLSAGHSSGADEASGLSLKAAIDAYTAAGAWASFDEQRKGTVAPGMLADLVVLSEDIFKPETADLTETQVDVTIFDGKVVYRRGQSAMD
jgi:predicted amidohydrolase YtcJ